jgi:hypothetical protein
MSVAESNDSVVGIPKSEILRQAQDSALDSKERNHLMHNSFATPKLIAIILTISFSVIACEMIPVPVTEPPAPIVPVPTATPTPASIPDGIPTSCMGGWTWAYGSVPPEFITQVQDAMTASGLDGSVQASTFGENDGCGAYHAMSVDDVFTVRVESQEEGGQQCQWSYNEGAWNSGGTGEGNFTVCPAPVSDESQRLTEVLNALSVDLACETANVTTNSLQSVLECERPEGNNRYIVTVTLRLNEQGYEGECFHGYKAFESSMTGDEPMTVTEGTNTYFERDRSFQWTANGVLYELFERVKGGGPDVNYPPDIRDKIYQRALQDGLIPDEGNEC